MPFAPGLAHHGEIPLFCPAVIGSRSWGLVSKNAITVMTRASGWCIMDCRIKTFHLQIGTSRHSQKTNCYDQKSAGKTSKIHIFKSSQQQL